MRDRITRIIAATRFPFIDQTNWDEARKTLTNTRNEKQYSIKTPDGVLYPSIIVLQPDGSIREIGEVEIEVTSALVSKWRALSEATGIGEKYRKLFLYVPEGEGNKTRGLLEVAEIEYAGLREWSIREGSLVTRPVVTPDMEYDHRVS